MATYDLPASPTTVSLNLRGNTGLFPSPLVKSAQTLDRGGAHWEAVYNFTNISKDNRALMMGLIAKLRGQVNRVRLPVYDNPRRGAYGGTPLVDGASQTGNSINLKGLSNNITNWIREGDYFSVNVNGEHELKMATADASSDGTGLITISFEPSLRASPANDAVVFVQDGVLSRPQGVFVLSDDVAGWSSQPFQSTSELSQIVLECLEDVFITQ